jgi:hypothetical protein
VARAEITYSGAGSYTAFVLDERDRELVRIRGASLKEVLAFLAARYPGLPVRVMPLRNPAAAVQRREGGGVGPRPLVLRERRAAAGASRRAAVPGSQQ